MKDGGSSPNNGVENAIEDTTKEITDTESSREKCENEIVKMEGKIETFRETIENVENTYKKIVDAYSSTSKGETKELYSDIGILRTNTNLTDWANQGVFLINSTLTVKKHQPNSHKDIGWNIFTDNVIKEIEKNDNVIVYILLGAFAQSKKKLITNKNHYIIETSHPSFFSCNKGFFGSKIFSRTNEILIDNKIDPIIWG